MARTLLVAVLVVSQLAIAQERGDLPLGGKTVKQKPVVIEKLEGNHAAVAGNSTSINLRPTDDRAAADVRVAYAKQELLKRAAYMQMAASLVGPDKTIKQGIEKKLMDAAEARKLQIAMGEIRVLARRALLIPGHLANEVIYKPTVDDEKQIHLKVSVGKKEIGELLFDENGNFIKAVLFDEATEYLTEENKTADAEQTTNYDMFMADLQSLGGRYKNGTYATVIDEGELEFIAKEMLALKDKSLIINSSFMDGKHFTNNGRPSPKPSIIVQMQDMNANKQLLGTIGFHYTNDADRSLVYVNAIGAAKGDWKNLVSDFDKVNAKK